MKRTLGLTLSLLALASCGESQTAAPPEEAYVPAEPSIELPVLGKVDAPRCRAVAMQGDGSISIVASVPEGWTCPAITLTFDRSPDGANVEGRLDWVNLDTHAGFQWAATAEGSTLRLAPPTERDVLKRGAWVARISFLRRGDSTPVLTRAVCDEQRAGE